ncbi:BrnA antitoxin family protein [candidate division CSSED10-310 bacterium]|uniref:BrnA antitoxin family protein n=1 Tax=candidate division CSSED10-310 bacterium TaxID=2855610 RepID=A0ABV6Z3I0_UNCC1
MRRVGRFKKKQVTIRIDTDVQEWNKGQGKGYQTLINELLRAYMDALRQSQLTNKPKIKKGA